MKRSMKELLSEDAEVFTEETLNQFFKKDERQHNSNNNDTKPLFVSLNEHREEYEKITIDGKPIDKFIADM